MKDIFELSEDRKTLLKVVNSNIEVVKIPDGVICIGNGAFYQCSLLKHVDMPSSVSTIGDLAFGECTSLQSIDIPNSVTSIGNHTFYKCSSLQNIDIPDSVTSIGDRAFEGCSSLQQVDIPSSVNSIGHSAFFMCSSLQYIGIPDSVIFIGNMAFAICSSLQHIAIPNSVLSIGYMAFARCYSLLHVDMPNGLDKIEEGTFACCFNLKTIVIPESVLFIDSNVFSGCISLESVILPQKIKSIMPLSFYECSSLQSINIPESVNSIGERAFWGCTSLCDINISKNVTSIDDYAFYGCSPKIVDSVKNKQVKSLIYNSTFLYDDDILDENNKYFIELLWPDKLFKKLILVNKETYIKQMILYKKPHLIKLGKEICDSPSDCIDKIKTCIRIYGTMFNKILYYYILDKTIPYDSFFILGKMFNVFLDYIDKQVAVGMYVFKLGRYCLIQAFRLAPESKKHEIAYVFLQMLTKSYYQNSWGDNVRCSNYIVELDLDEMSLLVDKYGESFAFNVLENFYAPILQHYVAKQILIAHKYTIIRNVNKQFLDNALYSSKKEILKFSEDEKLLDEVALVLIKCYLYSVTKLNCLPISKFVYDDDNILKMDGNVIVYENSCDACQHVCNEDCFYNQFYEDEYSYDDSDIEHNRYKGSYAQDEMGYSDDDIDTIFDGDADAYWNID